MTLNRPTNENDSLYEIDFTPKGTNEKTTLRVFAKNRIDASNYLILNRIWGKQHEIRLVDSYEILKKH